MTDVAILVLAIALDLLLGEPPTFAHPVVWMGAVVGLFQRFVGANPSGKDSPLHDAAAEEDRGRPRLRIWLQLICGTLAVLVGAALFGGAAYFVLDLLSDQNPLGYILIGVFLLNASFSVRALHTAARRIRLLLEEGEIEEARFRLRDLVSRDASTLDGPLIAAAAVESVAENMADSLVAPLFYFAVVGVPGAVAYRVVNTFDSMIGYRGKYEHLGKFAAKLDDLLNLVPARLAALLIVLAAAVTGNDAKGAWRIMARDHRKTASPNAGWTMSAAAGALGIQLEKVGHYVLGDPRQPVNSQTIEKALRLMQAVLAIWVGLLLLIGVIRYAIWR
ncbi:MAG: cobalamin biosynthesis protein CobD [Chloroflexi bacterium]|nr:cobalamin biosynthesis protein CobD [Chloroflexota bacterium]